MRWLYLPYYMHYRQFPNRMVKVYTPPTTNKHQSMACSKQWVPPTNNIPGGVLFNYFDLLWSFWIMGLGIPVTSHLSREWGAESTPLENNPPNMEDTDNPSWYMSYSSIQNRIFIWRFRVWHIQIYLERQVDTAYRKVWWTHTKQLWGLKSLDAQAVFPLSTSEG